MKLVWLRSSLVLLCVSCATAPIGHENIAVPVTAQKPSNIATGATYNYSSDIDVSKAVTVSLQNDNQVLKSIEIGNPTSNSVVKVKRVFVLYPSGLIEDLPCELSSDTLLPQTKVIGSLNHLLFDYSYLGRRDLDIYNQLHRDLVAEFTIVCLVDVDGTSSFVYVKFHLHYFGHKE